VPVERKNRIRQSNCPYVNKKKLEIQRNFRNKKILTEWNSRGAAAAPDQQVEREHHAKDDGWERERRLRRVAGPVRQREPPEHATGDVTVDDTHEDKERKHSL
jgi:hypothetical protein